MAWWEWPPSDRGLVGLAGSCEGMVRVVLHASEPDIADEWEDIIPLPGLVPAVYRLRASFRARDAGHQDSVSGTHLLEFWQAPPAPDVILRTTSESAACWHQAWGTGTEGQ